MRARLERQARDLEVEMSVLFAGRVGSDRVPAHVDAGNVFAMPCRSRLAGLEVEAWGIVLQEAQACGLPVLVGRSGGAPETLLPGSHGEVVDGRDAGEVAAALTRLLARGDRASADLDGIDWGDRADELVALLR
jgi:phosphatidylinositol alpha-1,6-mannosyltransferase